MEQNNESLTNVSKPKTLVLKLKVEKTVDKYSKEIMKDENGREFFTIHDLLGIKNALGLYDSKNGDGNTYKTFTKLLETLRKAWNDDFSREKDYELELELSLNEATFLKNFVDSFIEKYGAKAEMRELEIHALISVREQLL